MIARPLRTTLLFGCLGLVAAAGCNNSVVVTTGGNGGSGATGNTTSTGGQGSISVTTTGVGAAGAAGGASTTSVGGAGSCGDGVIMFGEDCDGANLGMNDCGSLGFDGGKLACTADCTFDASGCFACGDGIANGPEACDGADLKGQSCTALGLPPGNLVCTPTCTFDASGCMNVEDCQNGLDDDGDNFIDCADLDCQGEAVCQPIESITGCDPMLCTFAPGAGPNGGDLCECTIPALRHPVSDDLPGQLCGVFGNGADLTLQFSTAGYAAYSISTCESNPGDSSIAAFDGDPALASNMIACDGDASGEQSFCSEIGDSGNSGPALPTVAPSTQQLWIQYDAFGGSYWNNNVARVIQIELITNAPVEQNCTDGIDNDNDNDTDCADADCSLDPACSMAIEEIVDCDPNFCLFTINGGPNGGDLCRCTIPGPMHPTLDNVQIGSSCSAFNNGRDLVFSVNAPGYTSFSISTCSTPGDSSVQVLDALPQNGGVEVACSGDASGEPSFCSEIGDSGGPGPAVATPIPPGGFFAINVDEFNTGNYWNGTTTRQVDIELIP